MSCSICAKNNKAVELTCLNCGRVRRYSYKRRRGLPNSLKTKKLFCRCGALDSWDLENVKELGNESTD